MRMALIIVALAAATVGVLSARVQDSGTYKVVGVGPFDTHSNVEKQLNTEAAAGCQLVSAVPMTFNNVGITGESNPQRIITAARLIFRCPSKK